MAGIGWSVWWAIRNPVPAIAVGIFAGVSWLWAGRQQRRVERRLTALASGRPGDALCRFARAVDCRRRDTWIVRAVFEALQAHLPPLPGRNTFPIHPDDRLEADLDLDFDDLNEDACVVAERCGRQLEAPSNDPAPATIVTVRDLLDFFERLPHARPYPAST